LKAPIFRDSIIDLENKILAERSMELAFEGKRWYDLVRISKRRNDPTFMLDMMKERSTMMQTFNT
jgi:hypothetical protein